MDALVPDRPIWYERAIRRSPPAEVPSVSDVLDHLFTFYVQASHEDVWRAITDPDRTVHWFHGLRVQSDFEASGEIRWFRPDDAERRAVVTGRIEAIDPPHDLVHTFRLTASDDEPTRVRVHLESEGVLCRVVVTHVGFTQRSTTWHQTLAGWPRALSALKTLLETGHELGGQQARG